MSTIKQKMGKFRSDLTLKGEVALQRPEIIMAAECLVRFILALGLSRAEIFGGYTPFGIAVVAVSGPGFSGFLAFCGVILGSFAGGGFVWGLKYASMAVLVYAASIVFNDLRVYKANWFMPSVAAFMAACTGFVYAQDAGWTVEATVFFLTETVLVGGSTYFYQIALSSWEENTADNFAELMHTVSVMILVGTSLIAVERLTLIAGISIGRLIALYIVMSTAYKNGVGAGSAAGAAMGLAMDAGSGGVPFYTMTYAFSGLLSGVFGQHGKLMFAVSFILTNAVSVLWTWDTSLHIEALYEVFVVSMAFMLMPSQLLSRFTVSLGRPVAYYGGTQAREHAREQMVHMSQAFHSLYETVRPRPYELKGNNNDIATVFDRAADAVCRKCPRSADCWQKDFETTVDVMNNATPKMQRRGKLRIDDFPKYFTESCKHLEDYIDAVNDELKALTYRKQYLSRLKETQTTMCGQYEDMSDILSSIAQEFSADMSFEPLAERKLRRYLRGQNVEAEAAVYRDGNGRLRAEIRGGGLKPLIRDEDNLAKLSAVLGVRLCRKAEESGGGGVLSLMEAEPLAAAVGIASVRKKGQIVSGDRGTYFKTEDGSLYVILSDGMGTGSEAAQESLKAVSILEQFLKAGLDPAMAMKLLNTAFQAKNSQFTESATVDLMCINLFTGHAKLFKYGAAPSYIKKGKLVRIIRGESFAAGLHSGENGYPDIVTMRLEPGNFAVISSDGIFGEDNDKWLRELISEYTGYEAKELSRLIMETAIERFGCEDDMTVLAIYLEERA